MEKKLFSGLSMDGLESTGDVLGGAGPVDAGIYPAKIKMAYNITSEKGAKGVVLQFELEGGRQYNETLYITNRSGEPFYTKNDKKYPLPGFSTVNDLALMATGLPLSEQDVEEKVVKIYNFESKAEIPTKVPVFIDLLGKEVILAILRTIEDKNVKDDAGNYVPSGETRETNNIDKVFHGESGKTVTEFVNKSEAEFKDKWDAKNSGQVRNKAKGAEGKSGAPGRPAATGGGAAASTKPKSLFG